MIYDEQHLVFLSIVLQMMDNGADVGSLNPNVQEYLAGLTEEFNSAEDHEQKYFEKVYYYADTYFNKENKRALN